MISSSWLGNKKSNFVPSLPLCVYHHVPTIVCTLSCVYHYLPSLSSCVYQCVHIITCLPLHASSLNMSIIIMCLSLCVHHYHVSNSNLFVSIIMCLPLCVHHHVSIITMCLPMCVHNYHVSNIVCPLSSSSSCVYHCV